MSLLGLCDYSSSDSDSEQEIKQEIKQEFKQEQESLPPVREILSNPFLTSRSSLSVKPSFMQVKLFKQQF